jgi:hypothetical protein
MTMDPEYERKILALEEHFAKHAKKSTASLGRKNEISENPFRTPFAGIEIHRTLKEHFGEEFFY